MNLGSRKMARITVRIALLSLFAVTMVGCIDSRTEDSHSLLLFSGERTEAAASQATVEPVPAAGTDPTKASEPAVLFVAYVATPPDVVDAMLKTAHIAKRDVVYDLGCGDGRIVVTAAKRYGCRAVGYDLDRLRVQEARKRAEDNHVARLVRIEQRDILYADLSEATVVTLYLGSHLNARLLPQLAKLGPGARIVSHDFGLADIPPDKVMKMTSHTDRRVHTIYLWNCPLKTTGQTPLPTP
jgi:SAM-dependent methyltransferase